MATARINRVFGGLYMSVALCELVYSKNRKYYALSEQVKVVYRQSVRSECSLQFIGAHVAGQ